MDRVKVYKLIDEEKDYQNNLPSSRTDGSYKTVGDYLTMMSAYLARAIDDWVSNPGTMEAMDEVRKIAGIAVRCMEEHETPARGELCKSKTKEDLSPTGYKHQYD